jgi:ribA/ribD-fused uncharacterized protein
MKDQDLVSFKGHTNALSNMFPCDLNHESQRFKSSESAFQWTKATDLGYYEIAEKIFTAPHAGIAKQESKQIPKEESEEWTKTKGIKVMTDILRAKMKCCEDFYGCLMETGHSILVEATYDRYWGCGLLPDKVVDIHPSYWPGQNFLGCLLMDLRNEEREVLKNATSDKHQPAADDDNSTTMMRPCENSNNNNAVDSNTLVRTTNENTASESQDTAANTSDISDTNAKDLDSDVSSTCIVDITNSTPTECHVPEDPAIIMTVHGSQQSLEEQDTHPKKATEIILSPMTSNKEPIDFHSRISKQRPTRSVRRLGARIRSESLPNLRPSSDSILPFLQKKKRTATSPLASNTSKTMKKSLHQDITCVTPMLSGDPVADSLASMKLHRYFIAFDPFIW